jgi:hypothetical protein
MTARSKEARVPKIQKIDIVETLHERCMTQRHHWAETLREERVALASHCGECIDCAAASEILVLREQVERRTIARSNRKNREIIAALRDRIADLERQLAKEVTEE